LFLALRYDQAQILLQLKSLAMSNFDKVFVAIKSQCRKQKAFAEISCFEIIAKEAEVPINKLPLYLDHLQIMGLIEYSVVDKYVYLTSFGNKQEKLAKA
jgi:hypothetical protein